MTPSDRTQLAAERSFLRAHLNEIPADALLTRMSAQDRLNAVERALAQEPERSPSRAKLTFNGRPVIGGHGVFADFGAKAVSAFSDAVAAVAASLTAPLAAMGPIPHRDQNRLLITGTAIGSFGFELEEHSDGHLPLEEQTAVQQAVERTRALFAGSVAADGEELAEAASDLDRRALDKVREFLDTLATHDAVCTLQYDEQEFRFRSVAQVREAVSRMAADNLVEEQVRLTGQFEGVMPHRRSFEFQLAESGEIVVGKIGSGVRDPFAINEHLRERVTITVMQTRVGESRPRYLLLDLPWIMPA